MQTALQLRSSELPLRQHCDMDYIITIISRENKMWNLYLTIAELPQCSLTFHISQASGKNAYGLRKSEHTNISSLLKLWRWDHGKLVTEQPGACRLCLQAAVHSPWHPGSGADPKVWQSSASSLLLTASDPRGSRLLNHRSSVSGIQDQRIGEAAVEL